VSEPTIRVLDDPAAASQAAAVAIAAGLRDADAVRGRADWATTGGSSPVGIYRALRVPPLREVVPWASVHVWWGDDRFVPRDDPLARQLDHFIAVARGEAAPLVTARSALETLRVTLAVDRAARTGTLVATEPSS